MALCWEPVRRDEFQVSTLRASRVLDVNREFQIRDWQTRCDCLFWSYQTIVEDMVEGGPKRAYRLRAVSLFRKERLKMDQRRGKSKRIA